jgi:hypothetical protein
MARMNTDFSKQKILLVLVLVLILEKIKADNSQKRVRLGARQ